MALDNEKHPTTLAAGCFCLLRNSKQGIEISLFVHKLVKGAAFRHGAVFEHEHAVISFEQRLIKAVCHHYPREPIEVEYRV